MDGVCCHCQSVAPVRASSAPIEEMMQFPGTEEADLRMQYGESISYVMESHYFCGQPCDGAGTVPQALVKKENS